MEAAWAENRQHPQYCPTCHGFLRADGGCTRCDNTGVGSDAKTLALAAPAPVVFLSCGHLGGGRPGEQVWCTGCDDWAVAGKSEKGEKFDLSGANLTDANLSGAKLSWADLSGADLSSSNLSSSNLSGAKLTDANLSWANLSGAKLTNANLRGANLTDANLSGAKLTWAKLTNANLRDANLAGANLSSSNLSGVNLTNANLRGVKYNAKTVWPEGFTPPASAKRSKR